MNDKLDNILGIIDKIGLYLFDKFKLPADKALEIAVKQCKVDAYTEIATILMWVIPFIVAIFISRKAWKKLAADDSNEVLFLPLVISCIASIIFGLGAILSIASGVPKIIQILGNPEWYMIERVSNLVQGM